MNPMDPKFLRRCRVTRAQILCREMEDAMNGIARWSERGESIGVQAVLFLDDLARLERFSESVLREAGVYSAVMTARAVRAANPRLGEAAACALNLQWIHDPKGDEYELLGYANDVLVVANILPFVPFTLKELVKEALEHAQYNIRSDPDKWMGSVMPEVEDRIKMEFAVPCEFSPRFYEETLFLFVTLPEWKAEMDSWENEPPAPPLSAKAQKIIDRVVAKYVADAAARKLKMN